MSETVHYQVADAVATVTLARENQLNALDENLRVRLRELLVEAAEDARVRAVVLTGRGRAFCVGQDLLEHRRNLDGGEPADVVRTTVTQHYAPIATSIATMPKPVVAAVNGIAAGAGAAFALACDFRIVSQTAGFNMAFAALGLAVDSGLSWTLPRLVGVARAKELLLMPSTVDAATALEMGLATRVVEPEAVLPTALELAVKLAEGPTVALGAIRRSLTFAAAHGLADAMAYEAEMMALAAATSDHRKAVEAFAAKQQPTFRGE